MEWAVIREPDDGLAKVRISLGSLPDPHQAAYIVFRGKPEDVIELLEEALQEARFALPRNQYQDKRGRPQG